MASVIASRRCASNLSFSASFLSPKPTNLETQRTTLKLNHPHSFQARQAEQDTLGSTNGRRRPWKSVPAMVKSVNNSTQVLVKKYFAKSALIKTRKTAARKEETPFGDELKILPSDEGFIWAKDNYNSWQRTADIWAFVLSLRVRVLLDNAKWAYLDGFTEDKQKVRRRRTAAWLREQMLQLGPTFIKLGQLSSTRTDLLPREFVDELAKLQEASKGK